MKLSSSRLYAFFNIIGNRDLSFICTIQDNITIVFHTKYLKYYLSEIR